MEAEFECILGQIISEWHNNIEKAYEDSVGSLSEKGWIDFLEDLFHYQMETYAAALVVCGNHDPIEQDRLILNNPSFSFFTNDDIQLGINESTYDLDTSSKLRMLSPALIDDFWFDSSSGEYVGNDDIRKLITAFTSGTAERRVLNEVHCYSGDPDITIGMGHWAAENIRGFFNEMPNEIWKEMREFIKLCINQNGNISNGSPNINLFKTYREQFWEDFSCSFGKELVDDYSKDVDDDSLNRYFIRKDDSLKDRCNTVFASREKLYKGNYLDKEGKVQNVDVSLWGADNYLKNAKLLARFAMKDNYLKTAKLNYNIAKTRKPELDYDSSFQKLDDKNILITGSIKNKKEKITVFNNMSELRAFLLNQSEDEINSYDYEKLLEIFNNGIKIFNDKLFELSKAVEKETEIVYVDKKGKDPGIKLVSESNSDSIVSKMSYKAIKSNGEIFGPYPGTIDTSGYWFYDIIRQALCLRSVCYYQLYYFVKNTIKVNYKTNAMVAAVTSWKSSRFSGKFDTEHTKKYYFIDGTQAVPKVEVKDDDKSKALMYWHNYNTLRAESEYKKKCDSIYNSTYNSVKDKLKKNGKTDEEADSAAKSAAKSEAKAKLSEIRGRQKAIWNLWFGNNNDVIKPTSQAKDYSSKVTKESQTNTFKDSISKLNRLLVEKDNRLNSETNEKIILK